jgi:hypothetical protein
MTQTKLRKELYLVSVEESMLIFIIWWLRGRLTKDMVEHKHNTGIQPSKSEQSKGPTLVEKLWKET